MERGVELCNCCWTVTLWPLKCDKHSEVVFCVHWVESISV